MTDLNKLLSQMTIEEKIAQLTQLNANLFDESETDITDPMTQLGLSSEDLDRVGSVLNCHNADTIRKNQDTELDETRLAFCSIQRNLY